MKNNKNNNRTTLNYLAAYSCTQLHTTFSDSESIKQCFYRLQGSRSLLKPDVFDFFRWRNRIPGWDD